MTKLERILRARKDIHHRVAVYTLSGFIFHLPFSFSHDMFFLLYRVLIILLTLNWIVAKHYTRVPSLGGETSFLIFAVFYFLHVIGLTYTTNLETGFFQLEKKAVLFLFPLILATSDKFTREEIKLFLKMFVSSVMMACIICLVYAFYRNAQPQIKGTNWLFFTYHDFTEIISIQPNYLALYVSFSILILLAFLFQTRNSLKKRFWILLNTFALVLFLVLLSGRTQIVALFFIVSVGTIIYFHKKTMILKGLAIMAIFTTALFSLIIQVPVIKERFYSLFGINKQPEWINLYGDGSQLEDVRIRKWKCALDIIADHWLIGVGTGDVQDALQAQYKKTNFQVAFDSQFNAHNQFLQTAIGLGFIGFVSLCSCIAIPAITAIKKQQHLFSAFLALFTICSMTESILERQLGIVFFAIFISLFTFHNNFKKAE